MATPDIREQVAHALEAAQNKKAEDVTLLQLPGESSAFTDYFLICSGSNPRQVQAIADEVDERLSKDMGVEPNQREGYQTAEWILLDYVDFVVHIFNAQRRAYYDLERLWQSAHKLTMEELLHPEAAEAPVTATTATKKAAKKAARKTARKKATGVRAAAKGARRAGAKAPARRTSTKKSATKSVKKAAAKKSSAKKSAAKKSTVKKSTVKKAAAKKSAKRK